MSEAAYQRSLELSGSLPDARRWRDLLSRFLLFYGFSLIVAGIAAFFAYNWASLHKFAKFGLIEAAIVCGVLIAWRKGLDSPAGKSGLFAAGFLTGVLLAVFGQTYQTGADPYGLFLAWGLLVAGWAVIGRQTGLWLLMAVLANLSLILYWVQVMHPPAGFSGELARTLGPLFWLMQAVSDFRLAQWVFVLNAAMLVVWEFYAARGVLWMQGRWFPRMIASGALTSIVISTLLAIFMSVDGHVTDTRYAPPVLFGLFSAACLRYYQRHCRDLFLLAACLLGVIVVVTSLVARASSGGFDIALFLSLLVIGQTAGAAIWLRSVARRWRTSS